MDLFCLLLPRAAGLGMASTRVVAEEVMNDDIFFTLWPWLPWLRPSCSLVVWITDNCPPSHTQLPTGQCRTGRRSSAPYCPVRPPRLSIPRCSLLPVPSCPLPVSRTTPCLNTTPALRPARRSRRTAASLSRRCKRTLLCPRGMTEKGSKCRRPKW